MPRLRQTSLEERTDVSQGCCASRSAGAGPNEAAIRAHSSSRNITAPSTRPGSLHSPRISQGYIHPAVGRQDPVDRPNTPLTAIPMFQRSKLPNALASPTATNRGRVKPLTDSTNLTWTRARLDKERTDWWDTQVTGSPEVWGAVRLAAQSLQIGKLKDAQQWLETMECTCPTGCLWKGVYDSTGVLYKVPEWLIVEPEGLAAEEADAELAGGPAGVAAAADDGAQEAGNEDGDDEDDEPVAVRVRVSRNGRDVVLKLRRREHVSSIVEKLKQQAEVCLYALGVLICAASTVHTFANKQQLDMSSNVRLVYGGRIYQDRETLESHQFWDFANDYLINALVLE
jgi:hypothetical protein